MVFLRYFSLSKFSSLFLCALLQTVLWISVSSQLVSLCLCVFIANNVLIFICILICFMLNTNGFEHTGFSSRFPHNIFTWMLPFSFSEVLQHNLGKFSNNSLLQNACLKDSFLSDYNMLCLFIGMSCMGLIFSWVYTRFSPNVVLDFSSLSSVIFCFPHPILSLCTPPHSPLRNTGLFFLRRLPTVSLRRGEMKGIWLIATWVIPYMYF